MDREAFIRLDADGQYVRSQVGSRIGVVQDSRDRLEVDSDLAGAFGQALAGAQIKWHSGPTPVVDPAAQSDKGLDTRARSDSVFLKIGARRHARYQSRAVLAANRVLLDV